MASLKKDVTPLMKIGALALVILIAVLLRATWSVYSKSKDTQYKRDQAEHNLEKLEVRREFLEAETERLRTVDGMDSEIRSQFGFANEGEEVFIILDPPVVATSTIDEKPGFWARLFGWM